MKNILIVGAGGFIGSVCRYLCSMIPLKEHHVFPFKTFAVNIFGCMLIGLITVIAEQKISINPTAILFLKTGVCGGFTTFSTFALETSDMLNNGNIFTALLYVTLSIGVGIGIIFFTAYVGK